MKILVIGPDWLNPITESVQKAFKINGFESYFFKYYTQLSEKNRYIKRKLLQLKCNSKILNFMDDFNAKSLFKKNHIEIVRLITNTKFDLIFFIKAEYISEETFRYIKNKKIRTFIWFMDDPYIKWNKNMPLLNQNIVKSFSLFDYIFLYDKNFVNSIKLRFNDKVEYLPLAYDNSTFFNQDLKKIYNVSFGGNYTEERYNILKKLEQFKLCLFGGDWKKLNKYKCEDFIALENINKVYNKTLINLNVHHGQTVNGSNLRFFEIPGSGNFMITDYRDCAKNLFVLEKEIETYKTPDELKEKISYYMGHRDKIDEIATAALKKSLKEHTYSKRIKTVIDNFLLK